MKQIQGMKRNLLILVIIVLGFLTIVDILVFLKLGFEIFMNIIWLAITISSCGFFIVCILVIKKFAILERDIIKELESLKVKTE